MWQFGTVEGGGSGWAELAGVDTGSSFVLGDEFPGFGPAVNSTDCEEAVTTHITLRLPVGAFALY